MELKSADLSGYASVISEAGMLASDRAEPVFSHSADHHIKQTRCVHQVFLVAGSIPKREAFVAYQVQEVPRQKDVSAVYTVVDGPGSGDAYTFAF